MLKEIKEKLHSGMGRDIVWTFAIQMLIMLCSFAINKLLANRLSIDEFGQYNVIKRSVQVLSFVMLAGIGIALPRYIPIYRNSNPPRPVAPLLSAAFIYMIGISVAVVAICLLFSPQMQPVITGQSNNSSLLLIALSYAFILAMAQYVFAYYRGMGRFMWYNSTQLAMQLAIIMPLIVLPILTVGNVFGSWLIITVLLVAYLMGRELWRYANTSCQPHPCSQLSTHLTTIVKYASGRLIADFFQFSLAAFPLIYISNTQGLQATAYFAVGITFITMIIPLFSFLGIILLPYISQAIARHEMTAANRLVNRLSLLYALAAICFIAILWLFTDFLTALLFSNDYVVTSQLTRIMILAILPQAAYMLFRNTIDAVSVVPYNAIILGICLAVMVAGFMLSVSPVHFAWAYVAVSALQGLLSWVTWMIVRKK